MTTAYQKLIDLKKTVAVTFDRENDRLALCPDMGGRVFAEVCGMSMHRIDLDCIASPEQPFNNFGGHNFWPAPEGGTFGFNYRGDQWYVQSAINIQPFRTVRQNRTGAEMRKEVLLVNRRNTVVDAIMQRTVEVEIPIPDVLQDLPLAAAVSYQTTDSFELSHPVSADQALLAAWTLEQFNATDGTISFVIVDEPESAINFDFYDHPGDRIAYHSRGFTYRTDGKRRGQIGIKKDARAAMIGFYDSSRRLLCLRQNLGPDDGLFFNIADNDQPGGPYSSADNYSIFNSDPDMAAFELETVGGAQVSNGQLQGSTLVSVTAFALFDRPADIEQVISEMIGRP